MLTFYSDQEPCKACDNDPDKDPMEPCPGHDYEPDGERGHKEASNG